ncbi:uncharacterized protein BX664DRAFT_331772 [Halteromyces radiatus]|uniref:uncharacterized protein n=1 Tax=Halteromyces radiatus TaxID=101107 RepID=UPI002220C3B8|nr:uncharacterized protein BX664DRAFT_331772 [Halteromyces radiatus]KAI8088939.1 hypothetical protein BX664DRAFT_331772 [Halteromyces radiatus]
MSFPQQTMTFDSHRMDSTHITINPPNHSPRNSDNSSSQSSHSSSHSPSGRSLREIKQQQRQQQQALLDSFDDLDRQWEQKYNQDQHDQQRRQELMHAGSLSIYNSTSRTSALHLEDSDTTTTTSTMTDSYYWTSWTSPYAECPYVTNNLHLPVPRALPRCFTYDCMDDHDKNRFDTMVNHLRPYPFRPRAPHTRRLERKPNEMDNYINVQPGRSSPLHSPYPKRHSLDSSQIDRLARSRTVDDDLDSLSRHPGSSFFSSSSDIGTMDQHTREDDWHRLDLEGRIQWLTRGFYVLHPQDTQSSPPSTFSTSPPTSLL